MVYIGKYVIFVPPYREVLEKIGYRKIFFEFLLFVFDFIHYLCTPILIFLLKVSNAYNTTIST